jgi:alpha-mannosidase
MWIKQRNHTCETLLEQWAEPFTAWAYLLGEKESDVLDKLRDARLLENPVPLVRNAWRLLMECHPHDSICGCSIDQVHAEMQSRFDQVEQIGAEIAAQALSALSLHIETHAAEGQRGKEARASAIVVYNPVHGPRTDLVFVQALLPLGAQDIMILDDVGNPMPHRVLETPLPTEVFKAELDRNGLLAMLEMAQEARIPGMRIFDAGFRWEGENFYLEIALCDSALDAGGELKMHAAEIEGFMADAAIRRFHLRVNMHMPATLQFIARDVPGFGYKTYRVQAAQEIKKELKQVTTRIDNEFFTLEASPADGTLTVTDKRNGAIFRGLNRFVDGGDCGDEYNYCPPAADRLIDTPHIQSIWVETDTLMQATEVSLILSVPATLSADRQSRSEESTSLTIVTRATLAPGVERVDIATRVENLSRDHRLRVHFPVPFSTNTASYDGHFEVVERSIGLPEYDATWVEDPRPEVPQRAFTDVSDGASGLMIANRGLPEVEVCRAAQGMEIALTLLRCIGWLSRDDFPARKGHAGPPGLETPAAQMPGTHTFAYSIIPHQGSWRSAYLQAYAFNAPLKAVATTIHKGRLPHTGSFLWVEPPEFVVSAIKTAEDNHGLIIRGYNISGESIEVSLRPLKTFARISRVMLDETGESELRLNLDGTVYFQARGHEIVTLRFR